jgi:putative ABC transport system ATP-binding protein
LNEETIRLDSVRFYWSKVADFKIYIPKLEIGRGEKVLLLGESGSGKTTLLSLICGFLNPISGDIFLNEQKLNDLKANKKDQFRSDNIGIIFQQFNLLPYANVIDNITLPLYFSKKRDSRVTNHREAALNICRSLQLSESTIAMQANKLSVGQQQRVAVARALIGNPSLIIADEPTSSLDASTQKKFLELTFRQIEEHKSTLLMVSHDSSISNYFDRTINIKDILVREN